MKKGYLEISLLLLFLHLGCKFQIAMARHTHSHRQVNIDDCLRCAPGYGVTRHCNRHRDTECGACAPGHYSSHHSARRPCYPCSLCGLGLYVAHACTASKDTVCDSCHTYKGPHNEDFYERCVRPLFENNNENNSNNDTQTQASLTKEMVNISHEVPTPVVIFSCVAIAVLAIALVATCCVVFTRRRCKRVDHRYEAVATQEAVVML